MKITTFALMALISLVLTGCVSMDPIQRSVKVKPVEHSVIVPSEPIAHVAPTVTPEPPQIVIPIPESVIPYVSDADHTCLSLAIYHEARGENAKGQAAVGWVVRNRLGDPRYPKTICGIVQQGSRYSCQFSWYCDGLSDVPRDKAAYDRARVIASQVISGEFPNPVGRSLFFDGYVHGTSKRPGQMQIGKHRFYASYKQRG